MGFIILFYIIFGTNLLTQGPAQIVVIFLPISVFRRKGISNGIQRNETFARIFFGTNAIQETWSGRQGSNEAATRQEGAPRGLGTPPPSWAPRSSTDVLLSPIYTLISYIDQREPKNHCSTATTFCTREIPSWGLFRWSARGGIDHGGLLHQIHCLSDEAWVVYHRPLGP